MLFSKQGAAVAAMLLAVAISTPAAAQDEGGLEAYAGVIGGYDSVRLSADGVSDSKGDFLYGVVVGVQNNFNNTAVLAFEAEISDSSVSEAVRDVVEAGDEVKLSADRDIFVGVRAGAFVTPAVLLYAKGGYTSAKIKGRYTDSSGSYTDSDSLGGFRIGAGVEVGRSLVRFRGEYRYSDYGNYKYDGIDTGIGARRHQFVAGVIAAF